MRNSPAIPAIRLRSAIGRTAVAVVLAAVAAACGAATDTPLAANPASEPDTEETAQGVGDTTEPADDDGPVDDGSIIARTPTLTLAPDGCGFPLASEDGLQVFTSDGDRLVRYDVTTGEISDHGPDPDDECSVWTGDPETGRKVVDAGRIDGTWFGPLDGELELRLPGTRDRRLFSRAFAGDRVIIGSKDTGESGTHLVYDTITGELLAEIPGITGDFGVTFGSDGTLLGMTTSVPGGGGEAVLLDAATGDEVHRVAMDAGSEESVFDPAAGEMIVPTANGGLVTIDVETGEVVSHVDRSSDAPVVAVGVRPDGMVVVATTDLLEVVDRTTGPTGVSAPVEETLAMRVRPDGTVLRIGFEGEMEVVALEGSGPLLEVAPRG